MFLAMLTFSIVAGSVLLICVLEPYFRTSNFSEMVVYLLIVLDSHCCCLRRNRVH